MELISVPVAARRYNIPLRTLYKYVEDGLVRNSTAQLPDIGKILVVDEDVARIAKNRPRRGRPISKINGSR